MRASWMVVGAVGAASIFGVDRLNAASVTWKGSVAAGDWHAGENWDTGAQPVAGDSVFVNNGTQAFWGPSFGGLNSTIRNNSSVTINGGFVDFQGSYGVNVGTGGSGAASSLTVLSGTYKAGGNMNVGNGAGETGTITVASGATLDANTGWLQLYSTGTINSAGAVTDIQDLEIHGGTVNVTGGTFTVNRFILDGVTSASTRVNLSGGTLNALHGSNPLDGSEFGDRYVNFTPASTGTLTFSGLDVATATSYVNTGRIRLDGAISGSSFVVAPFGGSGSQVSLVAAVPEPASAVLLVAGLGLLARRHRGRSNA